MECGATVHTGGPPDGRRRRTASILAGIAAGLLCGLAQAQEVKTLRWTPPTERVDGSALSADQLAAHRVLCEPGVDVSVPMPATSWAGVEPGTESCVVRAVDQHGLESADSERVFVQWEPDPEPYAPGQPVGFDVSVVELPPSTGPPGGDDMSVTLWTNFNHGPLVGGEYTHGGTEFPASVVYGGDNPQLETPGGAWGSQNVLFTGQYWHAYSSITPPAAMADLFPSSGRLLLVFEIVEANTSDIFFLAAANNSNGRIRVYVSGGNLTAQFQSNGWGNEVLFNLGTAPTGPAVIELWWDTTQTLAADAFRARSWALGGTPPAFPSPASAYGNVGTVDPFTRAVFGSVDDFSRYRFGKVIASDDPTEDLSGYDDVEDYPSGGSTVEAGLETGAEAGAGFNARVVSRADISEATSAGSAHGASSTIRAAITEGATAQQVAASVASMAAQLAESTLAGAEVTARATVSEAITEPAGAGEAVSRQGSALAQVASSSEADAVLSAYLQAVAALAAGIEAGDSWAARLTAAATFSGAAEAGGEFAEDSVALIAAESQAGAQFAAAVHALAEQLEGATAGAAMAGIVSTLVAFSSASSAGAVFESAMRHADALQASAEAGAAFAGVTGELTGHLLESVSAAMVVNSAHQARATWSATAHAGASFVASGDVSALIGALAFVVAAEQRVFTVPEETRTFIVS